jgi:hypothetical protein
MSEWSSSDSSDAPNSDQKPPHAVDLNGLRIVAEDEGLFYSIARIQWSKTDASLYVMPYVPADGTSFAGTMKIPDHEQGSSTFDFSRGIEGGSPKMSLHEFGRCHASVGGISTSPVWGRKLLDPSGGHIATIECVSHEGLPTVASPAGLPAPDLVVSSEGAEWHGVRIPILVYLKESDASRHPFRLTMKRPFKPTLYVALHPYLSVVDPATSDGGVLVYAGWGPGPLDRPSTGVYVTTHTRVN